MRWPFGRRSTPADGATSPSAVTGRPAAGRPRDAWRSLPAVQRLIGDPPVVAPAAPFAAALATRQPAGLALAPLGHEVSSLATPGLLIGVATAAGAAAVSGRVDLPLQRRSEAAGPTELAWSSFEAAPESGTPGLADHVGGDNLVPAPIALIQRLAAPAPRLTSAATTEVRAAPAGRLDLRPPAIAAAASVAPAVTLPVVHRTATPATHGNEAAGHVSQPAPAAPAPARRPTLGEARRLGLGAPLRSAAEMNVQRSETGLSGGWQPSMPVAPANATGAPSVQALAESGAAVTGGRSNVGPAGTPSGDDVAEPHAPAPLELSVVQPVSVERLRSFPRLDLQRSLASLAPEVGLPPSTVPAGPGDPPSSAAPDPSGDPFAVVVSRSATREASEGLATVEGGAPAGLLSWTSPINGSPIRATSSGSLLRQPAPAPVVAGRESRPTQPPTRVPVVSRAVGNGTRDAGVSGHPMAAQLAALGITVHREPAGPVTQRRSTAEAPTSEPGASAPGGATVVPLQRAVEIPEMQVSGSDAGSRAGSAAGSTAVSPDAAGNASAAVSPADRERELDELARRLYGRIRTRLASELLADRERAGLLVDLR